MGLSFDCMTFLIPLLKVMTTTTMMMKILKMMPWRHLLKPEIIKGFPTRFVRRRRRSRLSLVVEDYKPGNLQPYNFKYDLKFKLGPNFIISLRSKKSLIRDKFE